MAADARPGAAYHHGDLRAALIRCGGELLAAGGLAGFSVAQVARRAGVSSAAPYRHFADRDALLAVVVEVATRQLAERVRAAVGAAGTDPGERLGAAAGAYTRFVLSEGVGLDLVYRRELVGERFRDLRTRTRALTDVLIELALAASPSATRQDAMRLFSQTLAIAHGYAVLLADGGPVLDRLSVDEAAERSVEATRTLVAGHRARHG